MFNTTRARLLVAAATVAGCLVAAPAALAGTINYTVEPSPAYTIHDNGNGIVKVTYNGCVTAGERQTLLYTLKTRVSADATATFNILKAEGEAPAAVFNPATVALQKNVDQTFNSALSFSVDDANNGITTFRIKLDPDSGEGLGQGAGVMVSIPCVLAAPAGPAPSPTAAPTQASVAPSAPLVAPTMGKLPPATSKQAATSSPCVSSPVAVRLRANELTRLLVTVKTNGLVIKGAVVRVTFPGGVALARSNVFGVATFHLRPRRSGAAILQSDVCFGADRVRVLAARATGGTGAGRFTG